MNSGQLTKCQNCGAGLPENNGINKCTYCGSAFSNTTQNTSSNATESVQNETNALPPENTSPVVKGNDKLKKGCAFAFLISTIVLAILAEVHKQTGWGTGLLVSNPPVSDSIRADTIGVRNFKDAQEGLKIKHIKKTNPDPQVVIRYSRVRTTKYATIISITFQNETTPQDYITYIDFSFRLFDKNGIELKTGDSNVRGTGVNLQKGDIKTEKWSIINRVPNAKKIKVVLKKVELGDTVWDY